MHTTEFYVIHDLEPSCMASIHGDMQYSYINLTNIMIKYKIHTIAAINTITWITALTLY